MKDNNLRILENIIDTDAFEWDDINEMRITLGLPPLRPGKAKCLKCDRDFNSWDVTMNRICPECTLLNEWNGNIIEPHFERDIFFCLGEGVNDQGRKMPKKTESDNDNR
jgi:hypothetical protein